MKKILIISLLIGFGLISYAQESIVNWKIQQSREVTGSHILIISAEIPQEWYIYGMNMEKGGPLPLFFAIENDDEKVIVAEFSEISKAKEVYDDVFSMNVSSYFDKVEIKCTFIPKSETTEFNLIIDGQACNKKDGTCVPVYQTIPVEIID
ncbi:MAG: protein-disulfide reductase DsbD family protein [Bacteroidales bacterium]|nr:protein-disulfide reductase DsbD family protein [Bacteroidales bacterium]MDD4216884.1 protein-disulfide reductase DsbD family protein [Bacteroidales bacterium]